MKVCAITMVRDDLFYIKKWIEYYSAQLGSQNLYVLVHGNAEQIRNLAPGVNYINIPVRHDDTIGKPGFNQSRFDLINNFANGLQGYYDFVIVVDADEFIVADPDVASGLMDYLAKISDPITLTPVGLDVYHHTGLQPDAIDLAKPILAQRPVCKVEPLYCKPAVTNKQIRRGLGNHYSNDRHLNFANGLFLFHTKYMDQSFSLGSQLNRDRLRANHKTSLELFRGDDGSDFEYRLPITARYERIATLPITDRFDFSAEKTAYEATWRRRRFLLQKDFWQAFLGARLAEYSFHNRFDSIRYDRLHAVPHRFLDIF